MMLFVSGSSATNRYPGAPWLGQLLCPRSRNRVVTDIWAADNAAFSHFNAKAYMSMIRKIAEIRPPPVFVTVPDVVGDAHRTRHKFAAWYGWLKSFKLPLAYVLQDGEQIDLVPWRLIMAVFVGGSTPFKLGPDARALVAEANRRGCWVHMGRVNSEKRVRYARSIGCDSVDGSGFAKFPDAQIPYFLRGADTPLDICHDSPHTSPRPPGANMPRPKKPAAAKSDPAAQLAEMLRVALEPMEETVGQKYDRLTALVDIASKDPTILFDDLSEVYRAIPRPADLAAAYLPAAADASAAEKERKRLSAAMLRYFDSLIGIQNGDEFEVEASDFLLVREFGETPARLDAQLLLEQGVTPEQIDNATIPGTPYFKVAVRKRKAG